MQEHTSKKRERSDKLQTSIKRTKTVDVRKIPGCKTPGCKTPGCKNPWL